MTELCEVLITSPDPAWLRTFTCELVDRRLCSSVHNFAPVHSIYQWQGAVHERTVWRASLHTGRALAPEIAQYAKERLHTKCPASALARSTTATPSTSNGSSPRTAG